MKSYSSVYMGEVADIAKRIDCQVIERMVLALQRIRLQGGRIFFLGVGGSAANASHAVNDFRKLAGFEAYCPTDNVSELTARTNDEGWNSFFKAWLEVSRLNSDDCVFVLSVGGGDRESNVSSGLCDAVDFAKSSGSLILGIVGKENGYLPKFAHEVLIIPQINQDKVTAYSESFQSVVWHLLVTHPSLQVSETKW